MPKEFILEPLGCLFLTCTVTVWYMSLLDHTYSVLFIFFSSFHQDENKWRWGVNRQLANPGLPGKWLIKCCVCVCGFIFLLLALI